MLGKESVLRKIERLDVSNAANKLNYMTTEMTTWFGNLEMTYYPGKKSFNDTYGEWIILSCFHMGKI